MRAQVTIQTPPPYSVTIGDGLCADNSFIDLCRIRGERLVVVTDRTVHRVHGKHVLSALAAYDPLVLDFPAGEEYKSRDTKEQLEDAMFRAGINRDAFILALGGGIVTDMAGFVASTYCRGIPVAYLPTTLLAMVDASVGGKTGVNTPYGKNMIGAFYQPHAVVMDTLFLNTLPQTELLNGFAEVLKHALLADSGTFAGLLAKVDPRAEDKGFLQDRDWLVQTLANSVCVKKHFVEQDICDKGARQALNLGHTIAHAVESLSRYEVPHGYAVAIGILVESYLSMHRGRLPKSAFKDIQRGLTLCGYPLWTPHLQDVDAVIDVMHLDKKATAREVRFTLLQDIGKIGQDPVQPIPTEIIGEALAWYNSRVWEQ